MAELVETYRGTVYPWQCDHMGHMNVMWYVGKFDEATWQFFSMLGLTPAWLRENRRGMAAVDQRIAYRRELHAGDVVLVRSGVIEVRDKVLRFVHEMVDAHDGRSCAVTQLIGTHLDTERRKSVALPQAVVSRAREALVQVELPWNGTA